MEQDKKKREEKKGFNITFDDYLTGFFTNLAFLLFIIIPICKIWISGHTFLKWVVLTLGTVLIGGTIITYLYDDDMEEWRSNPNNRWKIIEARTYFCVLIGIWTINLFWLIFS